MNWRPQLVILRKQRRVSLYRSAWMILEMLFSETSKFSMSSGKSDGILFRLLLVRSFDLSLLKEQSWTFLSTFIWTAALTIKSNDETAMVQKMGGMLNVFGRNQTRQEVTDSRFLLLFLGFCVWKSFTSDVLLNDKCPVLQLPFWKMKKKMCLCAWYYGCRNSSHLHLLLKLGSHYHGEVTLP